MQEKKTTNKNHNVRGADDLACATQPNEENKASAVQKRAPLWSVFRRLWGRCLAVWAGVVIGRRSGVDWVVRQGRGRSGGGTLSDGIVSVGSLVLEGVVKGPLSGLAGTSAGVVCGVVEGRRLNAPPGPKTKKRQSKQSINQSIDRSINQSINQSSDRSIKRSINRSIDQSTNQPLTRSINQAINRSNELLIERLRIPNIFKLLDKIEKLI